MQPLLGRVDANKTLPNVFSAPFESFLQIFAKRVYESNFATFLVISTLIFCSQSQCLQFFNILIFDLDFGFWICFFAFWIVKNLYLKNLFLKNLCCVVTRLLTVTLQLKNLCLKNLQANEENNSRLLGDKPK